MEDKTINVRWISEDGYNIIAQLPEKLFGDFVEKNCLLCKLARDIEENHNWEEDG